MITKEDVVNPRGEELDGSKIKLFEICTYRKQKKIIYGHYLNYKNLYIRLRTRRKIQCCRITTTAYKHKNNKIKHNNNLSFGERKVIIEMKHYRNISIYPFNKGTGFVVIKEEDVIQKIEEQIRKSKIIEHDPPPSFLNKFEQELT